MATRAVLAPSERTKIVFGRGYAPDPAGELTLLLQLYVVMQIFKISASEYLKYTRKYAILTLNNQKFSAEGVLRPNSRRGGEHPLPAPHPLSAFGASILSPYRHCFLSTSNPGCQFCRLAPKIRYHSNVP